MLPYIKNDLHADAVDIVWQIFDPYVKADEVEATSTTLTADNVGILTGIARKYHLQVEYRPLLFIADAKDSWEGRIHPRNQAAWFQSYYNINLPYLKMAEKWGINEFVIGTEMNSLRSSKYWMNLLSRSAAIYHGQISYAAQQGTYFPTAGIGLPSTTLTGVDMYEKLNLPASAPVGQVISEYESFFDGLPSQLLRRTAIQETGIEARVGAYQSPSDLWPSGETAEQVQANWFTAGCEAVKKFHLRAIFFWKVDLADFPITHPASSLSTFEGRSGARAIGNCKTIIKD